MAYRIAMGGIHIESSTFTPYRSSHKDFRLRRGRELLGSYSWLEDYKGTVEAIPLIHARALPGGIVSQEFFEEWFKELMDSLKKAMAGKPIDGVFLDIHGAMSVEGMMDAEGEIAKEIRRIVGDDVIISTTMDLHGNVSNQLFEASDLLTCYRTAPHIDQGVTRRRAFENLINLLEHKERRFVKAKIDLPILLPGEKTSTEVEPGRSLYGKLEGITQKDGIIDAALWMGYPWANQPRCHTALVVTGTDQGLVKNEIEVLAKEVWESRHQFEFVGPVANLKESVKRALESNKVPYFISDTGDNPGAGGSGDMNLLLKSFLQINRQKTIQKKVLFASMFDPESIEQIYQNKDKAEFILSLGDKVDGSYGGPVELRVKIQQLFQDPIAGRSAVVKLDNIYIIVTEQRFQYGSQEAYSRAGIERLDDFDIIVVKMGYLEPDLSRAANGWVMALTPGAVSQDMKNIPYHNLRRPLFPMDQFDQEPDIKAYLIER